MADNIAIKDGSGADVTVRSTDNSGIHTPHHIVTSFPGYDAQDDMVKMKSVQKKFRDSFSGASLDATKWDSVIGTGGSLTQASGTLTMASGTTANAETYIQTKEVFTIPFRVSVGFTMSQRIANQSFYIEAVSVNPSTGVPNGLHSVSWLFDGTTATQAKYEVQNGGLARLTSAASTVVTTASNGVYEIEPFADEAWFHSATLDAVSGRANSYRRHQQIPDPNAVYKIRFRWLNGATPPASTTSAVIQYLSVQDYAELTAEVTAGRGNTVAGNALSVLLAGATAATTPIGQVTLAASQTLTTLTTCSTLTGGAAAEDAATTANPHIVGGIVRTAVAPTTLVAGDAARLTMTKGAAAVVMPYASPDTAWTYAAAAGGILNTTTAVTIKAAGAALVRNHITNIQIQSEALTTATELAIRDGAGGTVLWRIKIPTTGLPATTFNFDVPLRGTAATLLEVVTLTASGAGAVYFNAQGFEAP